MYEIWMVVDGKRVKRVEKLAAMADKERAERRAASWAMASDPGTTFEVVEVK
jgi:hypothetical protein